MLITCPSCESAYNVPGSVPPGRLVKCAKCQFKWAPVAARLPPPEPPPEVIPALAPPEPLAERRPRRRVQRPSALALAWVGSACLLAAIVVAAIVWRGPTMRLWPASTRLYGWLHLPNPQATGSAAGRDPSASK